MCCCVHSFLLPALLCSGAAAGVVAAMKNKYAQRKRIPLDDDFFFWLVFGLEIDQSVVEDKRTNGRVNKAKKKKMKMRKNEKKT